MTTQVLTPNASTGGLVTGGGTAHDALADASDATYVSEAFLAEQPRFEFTTFTKPAGAIVDYVDLVWRIRSNVGGQQTDFGMIAFAGGTTLLGLAYYPTSSGTFVNLTTRIWSGDLSQSQIDVLAFEFGQGITNTYGKIARAYMNVVYVAAPTAPTFTLPTGTVNNTLTPTYDWSHNGEQGQAAYQLKVFTAAQGDPGGATADVLNTGNVVTSTTQVTPSTPLDNNDTYYAYVRTAHSVNGSYQWGPWSSVRSFTIDVDQGVPTDVIPAQGATVTTDDPYLGAKGAGSALLQTRRQWQIASNSGFSTDVQTLDEGVNRTTHANAGLVQLSSLSGFTGTLAQGTWYIRARFVDTDEAAGSWSVTQDFTLAHVPTAGIVGPTGGAHQSYSTAPTLDWSFTDANPNDAQTAYELELWKASDKPGTLITSGKTSSSSTVATLGTTDTSWRDIESRWRVRVYDQDDVASPWSLEASFVISDLPNATLTYPTSGGTVDSAAPTISWTFVAAGRTQSKFRVVIVDTDDGDAVVVDSGEVTGPDTSWTVPAPALSVSTNYEVTISLTDSTGLVGEATHAFTAVYVAPTTPVFSINTAAFEEAALISIDWSGSTADAEIIGWRVYRRLVNAQSWTRIYDSVPSGNVVTKAYYDYTAPANTEFEYAVAQVAESGGNEIESTYAVVQFSGVSPSYFSVVPDLPVLNVRFDIVVADSFSDEQEMGTFNLIGRGRRVEYGTRFGQVGSLQAQVYGDDITSAREKRLALESIRDSGLPVYLRNPFGDVWLVAMPSASFERVPGVGDQEYVMVTLEYMEITA